MADQDVDRRSDRAVQQGMGTNATDMPEVLPSVITTADGHNIPGFSGCFYRVRWIWDTLHSRGSAHGVYQQSNKNATYPASLARIPVDWSGSRDHQGRDYRLDALRGDLRRRPHSTVRSEGSVEYHVTIYE